jgi:plastocyanin
LPPRSIRAHSPNRQAGTLPRIACAIALFGLIAALAVASSLPAEEIEPTTMTPQATGRIEGEVVISTALSSRRPRFRIYADPGPGARPPAQAPEVAEIRNVVLFVQDAPALEASSPAHAAMRQEDERFVPHVLPVLRGTTVDFPNADGVFHNVFSLSSAKTFDLGRYPTGAAKSVQFDRSGVVQVFCHIHSDMSAIVLVLDNAHFAVPVASGHYSIDAVPPGEYTVVGWHERIKPVPRTVRVVAGETARLDFNIPIPAGGESAAP